MKTERTSPDWIAAAADAAIAHAEARKGPGCTVVCASGISPSGPVHLGNLREVLTAHAIAEELRARGRSVVHLHSWDDFDRLRKVPVGVPDLTFAAFETTKTVTVNTYQDTLTEGPESFYLLLFKNFADPFASYAAYASAYVKDPAVSANYTYTLTTTRGNESLSKSLTVKAYTGVAPGWHLLDNFENFTAGNLFNQIDLALQVGSV